MQQIMSTSTSLSVIPSTRAENQIQPVAPLMRWWFLADMFLVFIASAQLFVLSELTHQFFAWTIKSTLTAAFLGAAFASTLPMLFTSFRARAWANARIAVAGVWVFTMLTLILTLQHWDKFHWSSPLFTAQSAFWTWLAIYAVVPIVLPILWFVQRRMPGVDPARANPLPNWFRVLLGAQAIVPLLVGAALYLLPSAMIPIWLWTLTPLTAGAVGAWCIGIAFTGAWSVWENDWVRLRGAMLANAFLGIFQWIAVARYAGQIDWSKLSAPLYLAFLVSIVVVGALGVYLTRRAGAFAEPKTN